jgi:ADP-heptose:LPS heptosyltransferase
LALLTVSRFYVGNDSGVTHLAARCCPTVALFGPTDARVWRPLGRAVRVADANSDNMEALAVEDVIRSVRSFALS